MLCNLHGAMFFYVDLYNEVCKLRSDDNPPQIECVRTSSYKLSTSCEEEVQIIIDYTCTTDNQNVLIVDDIMDTGMAVSTLIKSIVSNDPAKKIKSIKTCVLVDKTERREVLIDPSFYGFHVPDGYLVGYGMGVGDTFRYLPDIYKLSE